MTDMKIKAGIKQNPVRGPLKAMPQTAIKPTRERDPPMTATKSVFKRLQPSNTSSSSNTSMVEVCVEKLYFLKLNNMQVLKIIYLFLLIFRMKVWHYTMNIYFQN